MIGRKARRRVGERQRWEKTDRTK